MDIEESSNLNEQEPVQETSTMAAKGGKNSTAAVIIKNFAFAVAVVAISWFGIEVMNYSFLTSEANGFVEKDGLNLRLSTIIRNGAKLDLVKHTFDVRPLIHPKLFKKLDINQYYSDKTPLSVVLNDICTEYLSVNPFEEDTLFYSRLMSIIQENQYHNPFDNLEDSQRPFFENVRIIIGNDYDLIQENMVRIGSELSHKNQLVGKYLHRSNTSFFISITALVLTLLLSAYQIYQGVKMKDLIKSLSQKSPIPITEDDNDANISQE